MISFVYFDVGGVVIRDTYGTNKWHQIKLDLGISEKRIPEFDALWNLHKNAINKGNMHVDTFISIVKQEMHLSIPDSYSMNDDFVQRFERNPSIWPVISHIHKTCRIGLLTNMYIGMFEKIKKAGLLPNESWDSIVDSSIVHLQKPNTDIYECAKKQAGVPHNEIFFIDNMQNNITGAQTLGWKTYLYDSSHLKNASNGLLKTFIKYL